MKRQGIRRGVIGRFHRIVLVSLAALVVGAPVAEAAGVPEVTATWIEPQQVSNNSATLRTRVNPRELPTTYYFEYVTEAAFLADGFAGAVKKPAAGESIGSGNAPVTKFQTVGSLASGTSYRYRVFAGNSEGPVTGPIHSFTTDQIAPVFSLPDGRVWEMVSPVDKNGGEIQSFGANFGGDVLQAAAGGGAVTYSSRSSFAGGLGAPGASQYVSRRGGLGWSTDNITPATESGAYGDHPDGVPYQLFSPDLSTALLLDGHRCETEPCPRSYSLRNNASAAVTPLPYEEPDLYFRGASPDLAHLVFSTCAALTGDATEVPVGECDPTKPNLSANLYERSGTALRLLNIHPGDTTGTPGASLAAQSGAISGDGSRAYWTDGADLYLREGTQTKQVDDQPEVGGEGRFETASGDGSVAYFSKAGHLWRYLAASDTATDLTPAGGVEGVLGASDNGAFIYYLGSGGVSLWRSTTGTAIPIASAAALANTPPTTGVARVSADGNHLAFVSTAELTNYDNGGFAEVYLYTAPAGAGAGTTVCASCNPSGERPVGAASLPGASPNGVLPSDPAAPGPTQVYKPRVLSADSSRLFFDSFDALSPHDTNQDRDVYQWEAQGTGSCARLGGCISPISSGRSEDGASFVDASADGSDVFFLTDGSLVFPPDPGSVDVYDARVGGGFPPPPPTQICVGDDCQPLPPEPEDPSPGTLRGGYPNRPLVTPPKRCKKGQVKKKGKCVRKKRKHGHRKSGSGR